MAEGFGGERQSGRAPEGQLRGRRFEISDSRSYSEHVMEPLNSTRRTDKRRYDILENGGWAGGWGELFCGGFGVAGVLRADGAGDFGGDECAGELERDE